MKAYDIKMKGIKVGEKYLSIEKKDKIHILDITTMFERVEQYSKIMMDDKLRIQTMKLNLVDNGTKSNFNYDIKKNRTIYSHDRFFTDELLIMYVLGIRQGVQHYYNTINSYTYDYYKTRVLHKENNRCNIILPVYAYLEFEEDGALTYYEDILQELTIEQR